MKVMGKEMASWMKCLIIFGVLVFISFLFPNNTRFKYQFDVGQNWKYDDLIAPFSFPIQKPEEVLEAEMAVVEDVTPFYVINPDRARQRKNIFRKKFDEQLQSVESDDQFKDVLRRTEVYVNYGRQFIDRIYNQGVIDAAHDLATAEKDKVINLRNGNTTQRKTVEMLLSPEEIDSWVTDSLFQSGLLEAEFLIPLLSKDYSSNVEYDEELTKRFKADQKAQISTTYGMVAKGTKIVETNQLITDSLFQQLQSYKAYHQENVATEETSLIIFIGYFLLTAFILAVFVLYLKFHVPLIYNYLRPFCFAMMWPMIYSYLVYIVRDNETLSLYAVPFCIVPIVINIFYNERLALFTHVIVVLMASYLSDMGFDFFFLQLLAGIVAILSDIRVGDWTRYFSSMFYIFLSYSISYLGLTLINEGSIYGIDLSAYIAIFLNVFLILLAYPLVPLLERVFGFTSAITLSELSDMNKPLLKEMSLKAPGTLQHSLQVANLAEAAARKIGADTQLVKVAALYHDIGKVKYPEFFIENQKGHNPHKKITPLESAEYIIEHVTHGEALARKNNLPEVLIDFILTHHGTTRVEYFYRKHLDENPRGATDESIFRYPGPRPRTREEAILMLADSIEAASKSLKDPDEAAINDLVNKIVEGKIMKGQLERSQLTFRELEACKREFKKLLQSIYHVRVEYPEEKGNG